MLESQSKSGDKNKDRLIKDRCKCHKAIQAVFVVSMYIFDHKQFLRVFFKEQLAQREEIAKKALEASTTASERTEPEEPSQNKKKKKKKGAKKEPEAQEPKKEQGPKIDSIPILLKFIENIQLKVFDEK